MHGNLKPSSTSQLTTFISCKYFRIHRNLSDLVLDVVIELGCTHFHKLTGKEEPQALQRLADGDKVKYHDI